MSNLKEIHERSINVRREKQYAILVEWDRGKLTGRECIDKIIELEKLIPMNPEIINGK